MKLNLFANIAGPAHCFMGPAPFRSRLCYGYTRLLPRMTASYLFVYGTLRKGVDHPMAHFLASRAHWVGLGRTPGRLCDLGSYPGLVKASSPEDWVRGDVYRIKDEGEIFEVLDRFEDCSSGPAGRRAPDSSHFERCILPITLEATNKTFNAWVYCYTGSSSDARIIVGGDYLTILNRSHHRQ